MGMKLTAILSLEKKTEMVFCLLNHENKKHIFNVFVITVTIIHFYMY